MTTDPSCNDPNWFDTAMRALTVLAVLAVVIFIAAGATYTAATVIDKLGANWSVTDDGDCKDDDASLYECDTTSIEEEQQYFEDVYHGKYQYEQSNGWGHVR